MKSAKWFVLIVTALMCTSLGWSQRFDQYKNASLYSDVKAHAIGDIVTILIVESTSGVQQSGANSSEESSLKGSGGLTGNLTRFLPLFGASAEFKSDHKGKAGTAQRDGLTGKITAVITEALPGGNLKLQGRRRLEVNGERYILDVEGLVRPKDITSGNMVYSYNLANVQIVYKKDGLMNRLGKAGWISRTATWLTVIGLGAAAYFSLGILN